MQTLEKIEDEVKRLSKAEQEALRDWLKNVLEDEREFTDEFKAKIERGESELQVQSLKGHRVLTPKISQSELADEMFSRQ